MDGGGRITKHLFVNGKIDGITNRNFASLGLATKIINVGSDGVHLLSRNGSGVDSIGKCRCRLSVVISVRGIRILKLLREFHGRHGRFVSKFHGCLDVSQDFLLCRLQFIFSEHTVRRVFVFKFLDRVLVQSGPCLLVLTPTLVLRIGRRMPIETISVNLENSGSLAAPDVVNHSLSSLGYIGSILSIDVKTWNAIMNSLLVHFSIGSNILCERIDSTSIINDDDKKRKIILSGRVQKFCHTTVLCTTFTNEHDGDSVIIGRWGDILLKEIIIVREGQFTVQQNTFGSASSVWELLRNKCPSTLEVSGFVKNVHGSTGTLTGSRFLHEKLGHDRSWIDTTGKGMGMLTVVGVLLITIFDGIVHKGWDGFLSIVKMHESPNFSLHILLVAGILESSCQLKRFVDLHEVFFAVLHFSGVRVNLGL
mmetsp:Transcript_4123/g.9364  ORF Transcript_4123/g.9364 Transcript_4123/m.9364 type:complete len:423 (+) Transcript_4123:1061-2329(+)